MRRRLAMLMLALLMAGCAASHPERPMAAEVTVRDQWASAAESGMAALFGTFANNGHHEARIVSATSPVAGRVEVHEVTADANGTKTMHPKPGGLVIPPAGTHDLVPGGDHLMLMDLKAPLSPGADVPVTVTFDDGSTLDVTAQIRDFAGANEHYQSHG
ncbi:copper chaperone PCu(A)C [Mycolicibacterium fluoranthenivorans]|uniref:Copper chaperone PCu(A)C n=1 Tax=Mycolicibacterium fluoranthenivorans TaxID=258505 RepID=A0A7G8PDA3_9MYCO|nr:copper chaperone PCu(A)C [Mycolicibacterium fluoranthenivorans]QNJ92319.1 copper chaperone PCu(A)C [Mycolicibacterium fluoranthenivorans]